MDTKIHLEQDNVKGDFDIQKWEQEMLLDMAVPKWLAPRHPLNRFLHVFGHGYESQYYSYLWAEVLEADLFSLFEEDLFSQEGKERLKTLYESGSSIDEEQLYKMVRGQDFSNESFMVRMKGSNSSSEKKRSLKV